MREVLRSRAGHAVPDQILEPVDRRPHTMERRPVASCEVRRGSPSAFAGGRRHGCARSPDERRIGAVAVQACERQVTADSWHLAYQLGGLSSALTKMRPENFRSTVGDGAPQIGARQAASKAAKTTCADLQPGHVWPPREPSVESRAGPQPDWMTGAPTSDATADGVLSTTSADAKRPCQKPNAASIGPLGSGTRNQISNMTKLTPEMPSATASDFQMANFPKKYMKAAM